MVAIEVSSKDRTSLVQKTIQYVRSYINENAMLVGESLPGEGYFAERLQVSKAVVREAFGALAALHVIDVANGRRAKVGAFEGSVFGSSLSHGVSTSQIAVADVWDVRQTLEIRIAELAALHRSDEQAEQILSLAKALRDSGHDPELRSQYDIEFHKAVANATGNVLFQEIIRSFMPLMKVAIPRAWETRTTKAQRDEADENHYKVAEAIYRKDSVSAREAMTRHFDIAIARLLGDQ